MAILKKVKNVIMGKEVYVGVGDESKKRRIEWLFELNSKIADKIDIDKCLLMSKYVNLIDQDIIDLYEKKHFNIDGAKDIASYFKFSPDVTKKYLQKMEEIEKEFQMKKKPKWYSLSQFYSYKLGKEWGSSLFFVTALEENEKNYAKQVYENIQKQFSKTLKEQKEDEMVLKLFKTKVEKKLISSLGSEIAYKRAREKEAQKFDRMIELIEKEGFQAKDGADYFGCFSASGISVLDAAIFTSMDNQTIIEKIKENRELCVDIRCCSEVWLKNLDRRLRDQKNSMCKLFEKNVFGLSERGVEELKKEAVNFSYQKEEDMSSAFKDAFSWALEQENKKKAEKKEQNEQEQTIENETPKNDFMSKLKSSKEANQEKTQKIREKENAFEA